MPTAIKAFFTQGGATADVRRFKLDDHGAAFDQLDAKLTALFGRVSIKWRDGDGDLVTIANSEDLLEATRASSGALLKVYVSPAAGETPSSTPETVSNTATAAPAETQSATPPPPPVPQDVHIGVECDGSGMCPIVGNRWHKMGADYDLCDAEFAKLPKKDKFAFELIPTRGAKPTPYGRLFGRGRKHYSHIAHLFASEQGNVHRRVQCDISGMCPIVGNRWHKIGADYDLCEAEFAKLSEQEKSLFELIPTCGARPTPYIFVSPERKISADTAAASASAADASAEAPSPVHSGVECDRSGACPIVGNRWHKMGANYDLCDAEFALLTENEKFAYELIACPGDVPKPYGYPLHFEDEDSVGTQAADLLRTVLTALQQNYSVEVDLVPRGAEHMHRSGQVTSEIAVDIRAPCMSQRRNKHKYGHSHGRRFGHAYGHRGAHRAHDAGKVVQPGAVLPDAPLSIGSRGPGVAQLQEFLIKHGLLQRSRRVDFFGPRTSTAIQAFQSIKGVATTSPRGEYDDATRDALLTLETPSRAADVPESAATEATVVDTVTEQVSATESEPASDESEPAGDSEPLRSGVWEDELGVLASMGFHDREVLVPMLERANGRVDVVVSEIIGF